MTADPSISCFRKKRYPDEKAAEQVRRKREEAEGIALRVYGCEVCGGWHLTKVFR